MNLKDSIHFVMQSKGGAGKSVVSVLMAQYLVDKFGDNGVFLIDTDPSNKTLTSFKGLSVQAIDVLGKGKIVDQSKFDGFIEQFLENNNPMLVDTGSGDFLAINAYIRENSVLDIFDEAEKNCFIHCPINYGQSADETLKCLASLTEAYPTTPIIIWENEFFGEAITELKESKLYKKYTNLVGVIKIKKGNADTDEKDFSLALQNCMTFEEVRLCEDKEIFSFMQKSRVMRIKNDIFSQLDSIFE